MALILSLSFSLFLSTAAVVVVVVVVVDASFFPTTLPNRLLYSQNCWLSSERLPFSLSSTFCAVLCTYATPRLATRSLPLQLFFPLYVKVYKTKITKSKEDAKDSQIEKSPVNFDCWVGRCSSLFVTGRQQMPKRNSRRVRE